MDICSGAVLDGLSPATRLYHYKLRMDSQNLGGPQSKLLEAEAVLEATSAANRVATAKPRDLSLEDCERLLRFAVEHEGDEDPLPPVFFRRLFEDSLHRGLRGGASQPVPGRASELPSFWRISDPCSTRPRRLPPQPSTVSA